MTSPPRLLTGITLLIWGGLTGHALLGLLAALLVEGNSWTSLRWNFKPASYVKAWHFSILCGGLISILAWLNGMKFGKIHTLSVWAPLVLLPVELTQRYGKLNQIPLNTFSFFARKKMHQDILHGRVTFPRSINTGYPYIACVVLATAVASRNDIYHFLCLALIISACLFFYIRKNGLRPWAWATALLMVLSLSFIGQWGILKLYRHFGSAQRHRAGHHTSANESRTSIGKLGKLKLSSHIFWRMQIHEGNVPKLLRTATYNQYSRATWKHRFLPDPNHIMDEEDYITTETWPNSKDTDIRGFTPSPPKLSPQPPITLIGELDASVKNNPIPLPHFTLAFSGLRQLGDKTSIERNSLGTVRMLNSDYNIVSYSLWTGEFSTTDSPPNKKYDLNVPTQELHAIRRINRELGLNNPSLTTREKINRLRHFFNSKFHYTTHLNTPGIERGKRHSAVGRFLTTTRSGHCEYFATATTLLLRESGVPARYCVGFAVNEYDSSHEEWIMRGTHAHAWCQVWVDHHWEDLDLTPSTWLAMEKNNRNQWQQKLSDWWQRIREDFLIWRTHETNKSRVIFIITTIISLLTLWIVWRLWKSRQRHTQSRTRQYLPPTNAPRTPLHQLEPLAAKKLGTRPKGTPLCQWLTKLTLLDPSLTPLVQKATRLHSSIRFDPNTTPSSQHDELISITAQLRKSIKNLPHP